MFLCCNARFTHQNSSVQKPHQTCTPLMTAFRVPCVKIKLANSSPLTVVWSCLCRSRAGITAPGLWFDCFVLLAEHLYLPPRNEHPVPGTWLGGAFNRQAVVKDKIRKDQMWPGGSVLENIIYRDLGRIAQNPSGVCSFKACFSSCPAIQGTGSPEPSSALQLQREQRKEGKDRPL